MPSLCLLLGVVSTCFTLILKFQPYRVVTFLGYIKNTDLPRLINNMANVTPGANETIKGTTVEGKFLQLIEHIQGLEAANNNVTSYVSGNYDSDTLLFAGDFTIPVKLVGTGLSFTGKTESFLSDPSFSAGTGGQFTGTNVLDYFLQVLAFVLSTQNNKNKNPDEIKNVTCNVNATNETIVGSFTLPFARVVTDTGITITPKEYLLS